MRKYLNLAIYLVIISWILTLLSGYPIYLYTRLTHIELSYTDFADFLRTEQNEFIKLVKTYNNIISVFRMLSRFLFIVVFNSNIDRQRYTGLFVAGYAYMLCSLIDIAVSFQLFKFPIAQIIYDLAVITYWVFMSIKLKKSNYKPVALLIYVIIATNILEIINDITSGSLNTLFDIHMNLTDFHLRSFDTIFTITTILFYGIFNRMYKNKLDFND